MICQKIGLKIQHLSDFSWIFQIFFSILNSKIHSNLVSLEFILLSTVKECLKVCTQVIFTSKWTIFYYTSIFVCTARLAYSVPFSQIYNENHGIISIEENKCHGRCWLMNQSKLLIFAWPNNVFVVFSFLFFCVYDFVNELRPLSHYVCTE